MFKAGDIVTIHLNEPHNWNNKKIRLVKNLEDRDGFECEAAEKITGVSEHLRWNWSLNDLYSFKAKTVKSRKGHLPTWW